MSVGVTVTVVTVLFARVVISAFLYITYSLLISYKVLKKGL